MDESEGGRRRRRRSVKHAPAVVSVPVWCVCVGRGRERCVVMCLCPFACESSPKPFDSSSISSSGKASHTHLKPTPLHPHNHRSHGTASIRPGAPPTRGAGAAASIGSFVILLFPQVSQVHPPPMPLPRVEQIDRRGLHARLKLPYLLNPATRTLTHCSDKPRRRPTPQTPPVCPS